MSYLDFYKLKEPPFTNIPDLRYLYAASIFGEEYNKLISSIENGRQLTAVYGKCGLGKTILSRKVLRSFEAQPDKYEICLLVCIHSDMGAGWLLQKIGLQMHVDLAGANKSDYFEKIAAGFEKICEAGKQIIIMIDEASMIANMEVFEEVRGLIDFMADNQLKFSVVLFGLPMLEEKLATNPPLFQRVETRIVLNRLPTASVTKNYIEHRLRIAGVTEKVFTEQAYIHIHFSSKGNPRLINIICDNALTEGYLVKHNPLDEKDVERVIIEMGYNTRLKFLFLEA